MPSHSILVYRIFYVVVVLTSPIMPNIFTAAYVYPRPNAISIHSVPRHHTSSLASKVIFETPSLGNVYKEFLVTSKPLTLRKKGNTAKKTKKNKKDSKIYFIPMPPTSYRFIPGVGYDYQPVRITPIMQEVPLKSFPAIAENSTKSLINGTTAKTTTTKPSRDSKITRIKHGFNGHPFKIQVARAQRKHRLGRRPKSTTVATHFDGTSDECCYVISTEEETPEAEKVTVKFRISEIHVIAQVYPSDMTIGDIKEDIAKKFNLNPTVVHLKQCNKEISDECVLLETCCDGFGIHEFVLETKATAESKKVDLDLDTYYSKYNLPDFITVHIRGDDTEDGYPKNVLVEIENKAIVKPFLSGYRDKNTGIEYLDAFTQTGPQFDRSKYSRYVSRDTQTVWYKTKQIDTEHDQTTQCFLDGNNVLFVSSANDFTIVPSKYQTYNEKMRLENKLAKIILIQRNWRRFLLLRHVKNTAKQYRQIIAARDENEQKFEEDIEKNIAREERAKMFPRTKEDFELLYHEVDKWKRAELKRIASMYDGAARIVEVNMLLDKEIQMLNGIERQRYLILKSLQDYREEKLLTKLGEPIKWIGYNNTVVHLDLLRTQRTRFLSEIYKDLKKPLDKEARLNLLTKVKEILIHEQDFPDFAELFDLLDREKNLLIYTTYCDVSILRDRQNGLFLELIKFSKDRKKKIEGRRMCVVCKEVKKLDQFEVRTRQNQVETCSRCYYMKFASKDNSVFTAILRSLQRDERKRRCTGSFAFILQVEDVRHIVEKIWHGHSILSKDDNLNILRLPRWIKSDDWSPWNCVCLTQHEARDHYKIDDPSKVYDKKLLLQVRNCHMLGRTTFHKLASVGTEFLETGNWWKVGSIKKVDLPPLTKFNDPTVEINRQLDYKCHENE